VLRVSCHARTALQASQLEDLALAFVVTSEVSLGVTREVELRPGGTGIPVTPDNVAEYIARVADWRLSGELGRPMAAFVSGFTELVRPEWVAMFNEAELQTLVSGAQGGDNTGLDVVDMRAYTNYAGGYHEEHPVMEMFWQVVEELAPGEQRALLKFVTACSRAPLLGFKWVG
jgi:ubiquitin-protein ligase E3 C